MTREEALKLLADARYADDLQGNNDLQTAHIMAIQALEQEPCEDCISRQAVLEQINCWMGCGEYRYTNATHYLTERVKHLPSVAPKPKTGHWEQYGNSWEDKFKCSECGKKQPKILCGERIIGNWSDYCPNCGAKMVDTQEGEE